MFSSVLLGCKSLSGAAATSVKRARAQAPEDPCQGTFHSYELRANYTIDLRRVIGLPNSHAAYSRWSIFHLPSGCEGALARLWMYNLTSLTEAQLYSSCVFWPPLLNYISRRLHNLSK